MNVKAPIGSVVVLCGCFLPVLTVSITLAMCHAFGHVPKWLWLPQISLTGNHSPERWVYLAGFTATAVAGAAGATWYHLRMLRSLLNNPQQKSRVLTRSANFAAFLAAVIAMCGLATQAIVPLQRDLNASFDSSGSLVLTVASMVHLAGAGFLFMGGIVYCITVVVLVGLARALRPMRGAWWWCKLGALGMLIGAFVLSDAAQFIDLRREYVHLIASLGQWFAVFSLICFVATYSGDFLVLSKVGTYAEVTSTPQQQAQPLLGEQTSQ